MKQRAFALASLLVNTIPGARALISNSFIGSYDHAKTPIDPEKYDIAEPETQGYWSQLFLLRAKRPELPNLACKIGYPKTGQPVSYYVELAKLYRSQYERLKDAYSAAGYPDIVPTTMYLVAQSPRTKKPAVAAVQTYYGTNAFDLLHHDNRLRLQQALREPEFLKEFKAFRDVTLRLVENGHAPDIFGHGNVLVVETEHGHALRFVDTHELLADELEKPHMRKGYDASIAALKQIATL